MKTLVRAVLILLAAPAVLSATQFTRVLPECQFSHHRSPYADPVVVRVWRAMEHLGAGAEVASLLAPTIREKAALFQVDPLVMVAIARQESSFRLDARGSKGEVGVFQILPQVWAGELGLTAAELAEPRNNTHACAYILAKYLRRYGSYDRAVRAYNHRDYGTRYAKQVLSRRHELSTVL